MNDIDNILKNSFGKMIAEAKRREDQFGEILRLEANQVGPCPECLGPSELDFARSMETSTERNEAVLRYFLCETCEKEMRTRDKLKRSGIPSRVLTATLDNYEQYDPKQEETVSGIRAWIEDPEMVFLVLLGSCGTGKGHLAAGVCRKFLDHRLSWITHDNFMGKVHALDFYERESFLDELSGKGLLVFDEIGGRTMTTDTPERFYRVLDKRYDEKRKTILIGNVPLRSEKNPCIFSITGGERIESRITQAGVVIPCRWEDYRTRKP